MSNLHLSEELSEQLIFKDLCLDSEMRPMRQFVECTFDSCQLSENTSVGCFFSDCTFVNCNFSLIRISNSRFFNCRFRDCKLMGIDWTAAKWEKSVSHKKKPFPIAFERCILNFSVFMELNMIEAQFLGCTLSEVSFLGTNLEKANFAQSDLSKAEFNDANLFKADFSTARNYTINACRTNIAKARFSMPEALSLLYTLDVIID